MTNSATEFLVYGIVALIICYLISERKPKNFPPGPWGLPILGHLPSLGVEPFKTAIRWKKQYGPIVEIDFASFRCVIISDYKLIKEAMNENTFAGRPKLPFFLDRSGGKAEGIIFNDGRAWQEQRRFTLRHLRDFGFGTKSMESIIQVEIVDLIENLKKEIGTPISTSHKFNAAVINALWTIIIGERYKQDDPRIIKVIKILTQNVNDTNMYSMLAAFVPWIAKYVPDFITGYQALLEPSEPLKQFVQPHIDAHFQSHVPGHPRDFLDSYIDEMKKTNDPSSSFYLENCTSLLYTLIDLFAAGTETTSSTLSWIFLYMARYPHIQNILVKEIKRVVGDSRLPSLSDRPSMPYTEAVIHEVMRAATLVPLALMHSTTEDVMFQGYNLPKDTMVMINLYEAHTNTELWGDPEKFRPERFLSADETKFERREGFLAFSTGKRVCLGESLARDELFLFTTSLFQAFQVSTDPSNPFPALDFVPGLVLIPKPHKLVLSLRDPN